MSLAVLESARPPAPIILDADRARLVRAAFGGFLAVLCELVGADVREVRRQLARNGELTLDPQWRLASELRAVALYLVNTTTNARQFELVAIAGINSRAGVHLALKRVEDARDVAAIDALIDRAQAIVMGDAS